MYTEQEARQLVIDAGLMLVEKGLVSRTWGNVSARVGKDEFVITPSGKAYEDLTVDDLVKIKVKDCSYESDIKPSSEKGIHAAAYKLRKDCNFVIHTHQFYASVIAAAEEDCPFAPCAKYGLPGTGMLKNNVVASLKEHSGHKTFLLARHGALMLGDTMQDAFELSEILEQDCKYLFETRVPSTDVMNLKAIDLTRYRTDKLPCVLLKQDEYIAECCRTEMRLMPYIDDYAQIVGPFASLVPNNSFGIKAGLIGRNAVLVKGVGAVCTGKDHDDAEAVAQIVSKNCAASCYVRKTKPLPQADACLQRYIYLNKYSKQKEDK